MTTPLSIAHSHAHAFFTIILLISFSKSTARWTLLCMMYSLLLRNRVLLNIVLILTKILCLVSFIIFFLVFILNLLHIFSSTINLLISLVSTNRVNWHLATSARNSIYDSLLVRLPSSTSAFISCSVSVKVTIISTSFVSLARFKVVIINVTSNYLISSMLKAIS